MSAIKHKMATLHLYETEGVAAQLLYSFRKGDAYTAAQAAHELAVSYESALLLNLLQLTWLLSPFSAADSHAAKALEHQDTEALLYALAAATATTVAPTKPDELPSPSIPVTIFKPTEATTARLPPASWTKFPKGWSPAAAGALWWATHHAINKQHVDRAFRLSQQLLEIQDDLPALQQFLESHGVSPFLSRMLGTVAPQLKQRVLLHAYGSLLPSCAVEPPADVRRAWNTKRTGGRKGRTFYVSAAALSEWNVAPSSVLRLQGEPTLVAEETATNYWTTVWSTEGKGLESDRLVFKDDVACEAFYEKYFPDDIPDEWSAEERAKSHGQVCAQGAPKNPWRQAYLLCFA